MRLFPNAYHHHHHHLQNTNKLLSLRLIPPKWSHMMDHCTTATCLIHCLKDLPHHNHYYYNHHHHLHSQQQRQKVVVIMGATGSGKSRLSIDLATGFFPASEIVNSDKIQLYRGLGITTNKIPMQDRRGVPHHLLGDVDPTVDFSPSAYRSAASASISAIASRRKLPLLVGGSNSIIYSLLATRYEPGSDVFRESHPDPVCTELRFDCCFLWVDVSMPVLDRYLIKRVDDMLDSGMFAELAEYFKKEGFSKSDLVSRVGLRKAIGVPELEPYFRKFLTGTDFKENPVRRGVYEEAVRVIKDNTCQLAKRQVEKIQRLKSAAGWELRRLDATEAFAAAMRTDSGEGVSEIWERQVVEPSVKIVKQFLEE